jgi:alpha-1,2-mannosyltransferase
MTTTSTTPPTRPERTLTARRVLTVAVLVLAAAAAHVGYGNRHRFFDLRIYWEAMRWWASGHDLYAYARPDKVQGSLGFTYPPFAALLLRPLGLLPFGVAVVAFTAVSVAALTLATYWLLAPVADRHGWPRWYALAVALPLVSWLEPIRETITFGQINAVLALLVVGDLLIAVPRKWRLAGAAIGLAAAIKLTPAIFIVYLLLTRRWRAALTASATAVAATLVAAAVDWGDSWKFWTSTVWDTSRVGPNLGRIQNQSLLGTLARLAGPDHRPPQALWALLAVAVVWYGLWRARRAALAGDETTGLTLAGFTGGLVSPVTWSHHLFWFVPALVVLVDVAATRSGGRRRAAVLAAVVYASVAGSVISWYEWGFAPHVFDHGVPGFLIANWYVLIILVLLCALPIRAAAAPGGVAVARPTRPQGAMVK